MVACRICGQVFYVAKRRAATSRYCSTACQRVGAALIAHARSDDVEANLPPPPTPEQIAERARAIRRGWTPKERRKRLRADYRPAPWTVPVLAERDLSTPPPE